MRMAIVLMFGAGLLVTSCECDYPLFPWVQLAGAGVMGISAVAANLIRE